MRLVPRLTRRRFFLLMGVSLLIAVAAWTSYRTTPQGTLGPGPVDALVVFGSPADIDGSLLPMQKWRVNEAVAEYRRGVATHLLFTGGTSANRFVESETMAREAVRLGVPPGAIVNETRSKTTLQNIENFTPMLAERGWKRVEVISSAAHLPRIAVLLQNAPVQWRLHAAPTPGQSRIAHISAYVEESLVVLTLRTFGQRAEPVIHAIAKTAHAIGFAWRYASYRLHDLVQKVFT